VSAGAVSGFRNVDIAARLYGTQGIRYTGAVIPFRLETGRLVLEKGTRADAPKDDPMYRFLTAEGTVGPRGALNLSCAGNVNMKLFNALRGGAAGGLSGGSLEDALKGILGGFSKGMAEEDFRDTTFSVRGTVGNPSIANLKTTPPPPKQQAPAQPPSPPPQTPKPKTPEEILKEKLLESIFKK
jgi:translocation and assembly module TamB